MLLFFVSRFKLISNGPRNALGYKKHSFLLI